MQRLFLAFPDRLPGLGLLLLRVTLGTASVVYAVTSLTLFDEQSAAVVITGLLSVTCGIALIAGVFTPGASLGAALAVLLGGTYFPAAWLLSPGVVAFAVTNGVALLLLGPGAYSVDARLFGRREIEIPRSSRGTP